MLVTEAELGEADHASPQEAVGTPEAGRLLRLARSGTARLVVGVSALAAVLRIVTGAAAFRTRDEPAWMFLSSGFHDALTSGDFERASAGVVGDYTSPGVTTMWIGTASRVAWEAGRDRGLWADRGSLFHTSPSALNIAQVMMAIVTAALLGWLVFLLSRWVGRGAAGVAGVVIATEPFFVAHGSVLHTDELLALFAAASLVATALALGVPGRTPWTGRWWAAAMAGALFGGAWLTKVSALVFLPTVVLLGTWALVCTLRRSGNDQTTKAGLASLLRVGCWWAAAAGVVIVAAYPVLWVAPIDELRFIHRSGQIAAVGHDQFFLGEITETPGPLYYLVALPLRTTPWFLVGGLVAAVGLGLHKASRGFGLALLCMAAPAFLAVSLASKQLDRYGLPLLVISAIAAGIVVAAGAERIEGEPFVGRRLRLAGILAVFVVAVHSFVVAPWGLAYFNPALGGAEVAEETVLVGWAEGFEEAADVIAHREAGRCRSVTISALETQDVFPCGRLVRAAENPTYLVVYVNQRQRMTAAALADLVAGRQLVGTVEHLGVTYAEIYGPRSR